MEVKPKRQRPKIKHLKKELATFRSQRKKERKPLAKSDSLSLEDSVDSEYGDETPTNMLTTQVIEEASANFRAELKKIDEARNLRNEQVN